MKGKIFKLFFCTFSSGNSRWRRRGCGCFFRSCRTYVYFNQNKDKCNKPLTDRPGEGDAPLDDLFFKQILLTKIKKKKNKKKLNFVKN
jgi:hypothetical protein